jgi:hypothetical protein
MTGMEESRTSWLVALTALLLLAILAAYSCAYFLTGTLGDPNYGTVRMYRTRWHVLAFRPAAKIESLVRGSKVTVLTYHSGGDDSRGR